MSIFKNARNHGIKIKKNSENFEIKKENSLLKEGNISIGFHDENSKYKKFIMDEEFYKKINGFNYIILYLDKIKLLIMNDNYLIKLKNLKNRNISISVEKNLLDKNNLVIDKEKVSKILWKKYDKLDLEYNLNKINILILNTMVSNRDLIKIIKYLKNKVIYKNMVFEFDMISFKINKLFNNNYLGLITNETQINFISDSSQINLFFEISKDIFSLYNDMNLKFEKMIQFVENYIEECEKKAHHEINIIFYTRLYLYEFNNLNDIFYNIIKSKKKSTQHKNFSLNYKGNIFEDYYYKIFINQEFSIKKKLELLNKGFKNFLDKIGFSLKDILENNNKKEFKSQNCSLNCYLSSSENCNILEAIILFTDNYEIDSNKSNQKLNNIKNIIVSPNSGFYNVENYFFNLLLNRMTSLEFDFQFISFGEKLPINKLVLQYVVHENMKFNDNLKNSYIVKKRKYSLENHDSSMNDHQENEKKMVPLLFIKNKEYFENTKVPNIYNCLISKFNILKKTKLEKIFKEFKKTQNYEMNLDFYYSSIQSYIGIFHLLEEKNIIDNNNYKKISNLDLYKIVTNECKHKNHYVWKNISTIKKNMIKNYFKNYPLDNNLFNFINYRDIDKDTSNLNYLGNEIYKNENSISENLSFDLISEEKNFNLKMISFKKSFSILNLKNKSIFKKKTKKILFNIDKINPCNLPSNYKNSIINYLKIKLNKDFDDNNLLDNLVFFRLNHPIIYGKENEKKENISSIIYNLYVKKNTYNYMINNRLSLGFQIIKEKINKKNENKVIYMMNGFDTHIISENEDGVISVKIQSESRKIRINNDNIIIKKTSIHPFLYSFQYLNLFSENFENRESILFHNDHINWNKVEIEMFDQNYNSFKELKKNEFFKIKYYIYDEDLFKKDSKLEESKKKFENIISKLKLFFKEEKCKDNFDIEIDNENNINNKEIVIIKNKDDLMIMKIIYKDKYILKNTLNLNFYILFFNNFEFKLLIKKFFNIVYECNLKINKFSFYSFRKIKNIEHKINIKFKEELNDEEIKKLLDDFYDEFRLIIYKNLGYKYLLINEEGFLLVLLNNNKIKLIGNDKISKHEGIEKIKTIYSKIIVYLENNNLI